VSRPEVRLPIVRQIVELLLTHRPLSERVLDEETCQPVDHRM
jgi:hypothetical protein